MKNTQKNRRFDVSFEQRREQSLHAVNAYRLPQLGYSLYRVYETHIDTPQKMSHTVTCTIDKGTILIRRDYITPPPEFTVRWLKNKHATALRMQGYSVEPAEPGDKTTKVGL